MLNKLILAAILLTGCRKPEKDCPSDQVCNPATVTIGNLTNDTVFMGLQKNYHDTFISPGGNYVYQSGDVNVTYRKRTCEEVMSGYSTAQMSTTYGHWAFNIDHCNKKVNFRYDDASKVTVSLYDDSEE
jgi:hypothetical protein